MRFFLYALALFALGAAPAHADPVTAFFTWVGTSLAAGGATAAMIRIGIA